MKISKIKISPKKLENNFLFYLFLKEINGINGLNERELYNLLERYYTIQTGYLDFLEIFKNEINKIKKEERKENLKKLLLKITDEKIFDLFIFALKLVVVKPLLLEEAKISASPLLCEKNNKNLLSIEYDDVSKNKPYYTRVTGALLSLLFFDKLEQNNFILKDSVDILKMLMQDYKKAKNIGVEPNQIFMLMFTESMNQSIISDAGESYENRILNVLLALGLKNEDIKKCHDEKDRSTEYDFFFMLKNKTYGISAKRTLRERYKQFIKTKNTTKIDVAIEITLGLDLNEDRAKTIIQHGVYLFIADEIYNSRKYLQKMGGVFKASDLSINLLKTL